MFIEPITLQPLKAPLGAEGENPWQNTFSQIYIQTVFAVNGRLSLVRPEFKEDLYKYITGIVRNNGQKLVSINGMSDHIHILIGLKPAMALADLVRDIKADSSNFINKKKWVRGKFSWQEVMEPFRMDIFNSTRSFATFRIRRSIIRGARLEMNIWHG
jgi:REP element-mobilizing transposase RayT